MSGSNLTADSVWLALQTLIASIPGGLFAKAIPVYPSFLVPENAQPPYIVANIDRDRTTPLQDSPAIVWPDAPSGWQSGEAYQLAKDHVELVPYGLSNAQAIQLMASLTQLCRVRARPLPEQTAQDAH